MSKETVEDVLGSFTISDELVDAKDNTRLYEALMSNDVGRYSSLISDGYNPFKKINGKHIYQHSDDEVYFELSKRWIYNLVMYEGYSDSSSCYSYE